MGWERFGSRHEISPVRGWRLACGVLAFVMLAGALLVGGSTAFAAQIASGDQRWASRYDGPVNDDDSADSIAVSPDGSIVFVSGTSAGIDDDYATVAYDAVTGVPLWTRRYNGPSNHDDRAADSVVSPDGSALFVTGTSLGSDTFDDYATVAFDASTGLLLWVRRYNGTGGGNDAASSVTVSPDSSMVFVTGTSRSPTPYDDYATVAYDASTGATAWVRRYGGPGIGDDAATAITLTPDGSRIIVTGASPGETGTSDYATIAYDASSGAVEWFQRYNGPSDGYDAPTVVVPSPDGSRIFVTGESFDAETDLDYLTIAYDTSVGTALWARRYNGPPSPFGGPNSDTATSAAISPDGATVFVTGASRHVSIDYATVAYDAVTGQTLWVRRYNHPQNDGANPARSIAASPDGSKVFVTGDGYRADVSNFDCMTIAYDARTGTVVWAGLFSHLQRAEDHCYAVVVSPDGSTLYVTGSSWSREAENNDFATVAYEA
jgi:PQQ-like domain